MPRRDPERQVSVPSGKRKPSSVEFDNSYYRVHDDVCDMVANGFYAPADVREREAWYIARQGDEMLGLTFRLLCHIKVANSIYPTCRSELEERRINQDRAIGVCYTLLAHYQMAMHRLRVPDDKHTDEVERLLKEISSLKAWRTSDARFRRQFPA